MRTRKTHIACANSAGTAIAIIAGLVCGSMTILVGCKPTAGIFESDSARKEYVVPARVPTPKDNAMTPARVELGKKLFFDPRLSGSGIMSCATCHNPTLDWADGLALARGDLMGMLDRNTPTIINTAFNTSQFWDGRAATLEDQALGPIASRAEMNMSIVIALSTIRDIKGYQKWFELAYPGEGINKSTLARAIASFERSIISRNTAFDQVVRGSSGAMSEQAKEGFKLFNGKGRCNKCHTGFNFTDNSFHNIGVKPAADGFNDQGRFVITPLPAMRGAFKTPTLRNVARTGPYMHNGIYKTLDEVMDHYIRGGDVTDNLSVEMKPVDLTPGEKAAIIAFMRALTDDTIRFTLPRLPN